MVDESPEFWRAVSSEQTQQPQQWQAPTGTPVAPGWQQSQGSSAARRWGSAAMVAAILGSGLVLRGPVTTMAETLIPSARPAASSPVQPGQGNWGNEQDVQPAQQRQQGNRPAAQTGQSTAAEALQRGVVLINATSNTGKGAGTGMVLTADGRVLTNYHVVQSSTSISVEIATTGKTYRATVIGHDAARDVALLQLEGASGLETITLDDDHDLAVGSEVVAVGNSEGQGYLSAVPGTVTDLDSSITVTDRTSASGTETLTDVIETTAQAVPGDSGGPMFDAEGEVIGMTTAGQQQASRRGATTVASYAVPITRAIEVVDQITAGHESGTVRIGPKAYLGVSVQTDQYTGELVVSQVVAGQPAEQAGLRQGDRITSLDGRQIATHADLSEVLGEHEPDDQLELTWVTSTGEQHSGRVILGASPVN